MADNEMNFEQKRWTTFDNNWPHTFLSPRILAKSGFFYVGPHDRVKCNFCRIHLENWEQDDNEILEHFRWSPYCPLLNQNQTTNVPIEPNAELIELLSQINGDANKEYVNEKPKLEKLLLLSYGNSTQTTFENSAVNLSQQIAFPDFMTKIARMETFTNWPESKNQKPDQLSEAGFFFTQKK